MPVNEFLRRRQLLLFHIKAILYGFARSIRLGDNHDAEFMSTYHYSGHKQWSSIALERLLLLQSSAPDYALPYICADASM